HEQEFPQRQTHFTLESSLSFRLISYWTRLTVDPPATITENSRFVKKIATDNNLIFGVHQ
ncbi:MAG: hypothetical protein ABW155_05015, partial [Candidatus Thiodiazotropha sp.]